MNNEPLEREPIDRVRARWKRIYLTGIDAREGFRAQPVQGADRPLRPYNSLVMFERRQNIVENRRGGRLAPTTVNSSVRTREYLTTAEIERLMAAARKSSRYGHLSV
jgi:hypothetical protein